MKISSHAIIHPGASIAQDVVVGPFAIIESEVEIGENTIISAHAVIKSGTRIGRNCSIHEGSVIGGDPQDLKYEGERTTLVLEDGVTVREFCTLNRGTKAKGETRIKTNALIMAYSHVAHDVTIGQNAILSNCSQIAGHVIVEDFAILGGMTAVQQFVRIGRFAYIGGGTLVRKDVPPYIKAAREPLSFMGVNVIGLNRRSVDKKVIQEIEDAYRILFIKNSNLSIGLEEVKRSMHDSEVTEEILDFIEKSQNGIIKGFKKKQ